MKKEDKKTPITGRTEIAYSSYLITQTTSQLISMCCEELNKAIHESTYQTSICYYNGSFSVGSYYFKYCPFCGIPLPRKLNILK